ncbi:MAG: glycosyltransferase family 4 protein [Candidatus Methanoperedens sp.]|nr:glycosyltransferase family 4 protein [Candidatus Methanoperedens sp.]MCZ7370282.1 glycosyltransferase family 4 protein [Candidatus Methanoperedens sp.]
MESLNIGIITYHLDKGNGIDSAVVRFAEGLSKRNNVTLIASRNNFETDVPFLQINQDNSKIPGAHKILNKMDLDVLSSHFVPSNFIASRTKFFHVMHDAGLPDFYLMNGLRERLFWLKSHLLNSLSLKRVDIVFSISEYLKRELIRRYKYKGEVHVLPYGLNVPGPQRKIDGNFILYVGRHMRYKNIHTLFKIFDAFSKDHPDVYLYTIGIQPDPDYYEELLCLSKNKKIKMMGYVENVYDYIYTCRAYVNASLWEGQDLPVIESQMLGRPAITYNNCSHPETNFSGYLAKNENHFAELIASALDTKVDPRPVIEKFSMDSMVNNFEKLISRKLNEGVKE